MYMYKKGKNSSLGNNTVTYATTNATATLPQYVFKSKHYSAIISVYLIDLSL